MTAAKKNAGCFIMLAMIAVVARADTLWIGSKNPIEADGVKIQQVTGDQIQYTTATGAQATKPLSQVPQINVDGKSSFNAGENAFVGGDFSTAITNYRAVLTTSGERDWILIRSAMRLSEAGKTSNKFDAQVEAYTTLLRISPATAAQYKPDEPVAHSPDLDPALADITKAMESSTFTDSQKTSLLDLQLQIDRVKGDSAAVNATLQQLVSMGGASESDKAALKLAAAAVAIDAKQYAEALNDIQQSRALYTAPDQQVEALYLIAEAQQGIDGTKFDTETLKNQGLAYMRVVTFGSLLANRPHVAESLYQTGMIEEKLKEPKTALPLYEKVVRDKAFANSPAVALAQAAIDRLGKEASQSK